MEFVTYMKRLSSESRKLLICLLIAVVIVSVVVTSVVLSPTLLKRQTTGFHFPAEFEEHEAVWVGWGKYEGVQGYPIEPVSLKIVETLVPFVKVKIPVYSLPEITRIKTLLKNNNVPLENVSFFPAPCVSVWWRDFGPIFLVDEEENMRIADFNFSFWGYMSTTANISRMYEKVDRHVANEMGIETIATAVISEGGDREFNGRGTLIVTESVELQRNPNVSKEEIEDEFKRVFGVKKVIWLKNGVYDDEHFNMGRVWGPAGVKDAYLTGGTGGHVDEFCRFVGPNIILLAEATAEEAKSDPVAKENRIRMEENFEILKGATDQDGNPFEIVRMPIPETEYITISPRDPIYQTLAEANFKDGHIFPRGQSIKLIPASSYCNFLITNGIVLAPKYWEPGKPKSVKLKDERAIEILQSLFPDRKIIAINPLPLNLDGGGIHCCTQQEPFANT